MSKTASQAIDEVDFSSESLDTQGNKRKRTGEVSGNTGNSSTHNDTQAGESQKNDSKRFDFCNTGGERIFYPPCKRDGHLKTFFFNLISYEAV